MKIITSYTVSIKQQLHTFSTEKDGKAVSCFGTVDKSLMDKTADICLAALQKTAGKAHYFNGGMKGGKIKNMKIFKNNIFYMV